MFNNMRELGILVSACCSEFLLVGQQGVASDAADISAYAYPSQPVAPKLNTCMKAQKNSTKLTLEHIQPLSY